MTAPLLRPVALTLVHEHADFGGSLNLSPKGVRILSDEVRRLEAIEIERNQMAAVLQEVAPQRLLEIIAPSPVTAAGATLDEIAHGGPR